MIGLGFQPAQPLNVSGLNPVPLAIEKVERFLMESAVQTGIAKATSNRGFFLPFFW
jgi:hypothetical protein